MSFIEIRRSEMPVRILIETIEPEPFGLITVLAVLAERPDAQRRAAARVEGSVFDSEGEVLPLPGPEIRHDESLAGVGASWPIVNAMFPLHAGGRPIGQDGRACGWGQFGDVDSD
jgi:hypothetical protein